MYKLYIYIYIDVHVYTYILSIDSIVCHIIRSTSYYSIVNEGELKGSQGREFEHLST